MGEYVVHRARFFNFQPKAVQSMSYDDITKKLAISRSDSKIEIWSLKNDEFVESIIVPTSDRQVEVVLWCRSQLLSAGLDGFIVIYDLARLTPKKLVASVGGAIWCMTKNKSETKIVVGTEDGYVVIYEMQIDGVLFEKTLNKQDSRILSIAWHKDEEILATGGIDNIRVWDVNTGQVMQRISLGRIDKNKETLVWCLAITSNFSIISGDSRGKISVWNSEFGTLTKSFQTHSVDVLCLCLDESETHVYCSGIDPSIVRLDFVTMNETKNFKSWVKSNVYYNHTHDVRSILIADNRLISAGVDTKIVIKSIDDKSTSPSIRKYSSMPQKSVVETCDDFVLLQYDKHLEIWKLGDVSGREIDLSSMNDGDMLQASRSPRKYLHLRSKSDLNIVCSSIGSDPNNKPNGSQTHILWLAYSDLNVIHIYKLEIAKSKQQPDEPKLKIDKVESLPLACGNRPAVLMKFCSYKSNSLSDQLRLCYLTNKSCLQCLKLVNFESGFVLESSIQCISQELLLTDNRVYLFALKDDYGATVDTDMNLIVWSLKTQTQLCALPRYEHLATCLSFHPTKNYLLVAYANRKIMEFDFESGEYTEWSKEVNEKYPKQWLKQSTKLLDCFYDKLDLNKIITYDEQYFSIINKTQKMPEFNEKIFQQQQLTQALKNGHQFMEDDRDDEKKTNHALHITNKYKYIIHANQLKNNQFLIVELTPLSVLERLPPSLKQKKFGT